MVTRNIIHTDQARIDFRTSDEPFFGAHRHRDYEIYYHLSGDVIRRFEDREYRPPPKSLLLVPPKTFHEWRILSKEPCTRFSIHFYDETLRKEAGDLLFTLFLSPRLYDINAAPLEIGSLAQALLDCSGMEPGLQNLAVKSRLLALITALYELGDRYTVPPQPVSVDRRIQAILIWLDDNLAAPVSLDDLAQRFNISKNHLNVLFRQETGTTALDLLRSLRCTSARQRIHQGLPVEEAAYSVGYNNYSAFFRAYKAVFGVSPRTHKNKG